MVRFSMAMIAAAFIMVIPAISGKTDQKQASDWGTRIDPCGDCRFDLNGSALTITVPGPVHGLSSELGVMNAPRTLQNVNGDCVIQVCVKGDFAPGDSTIKVRTGYQSAGLVLMADEKTYIRLERAALSRDGQPTHYANFELRENSQVARYGSPHDFLIDPEKETMLKLARKGNVVFGFVKQTGAKEWHCLGSKEVELPKKVQVGIAACNSSTQDQFRPTFEDLKLRSTKQLEKPSVKNVKTQKNTQ